MPNSVNSLWAWRSCSRGVESAALAAEPFAVDKVGAGEVHPNAGAGEAFDRLAIERLGRFAVAEQRPRAGLDAERPIGATGRGCVRKPAEGIGGEPGLAAPDGRLDQLDQSPTPPPRGVCVLTGLLRRHERLLVATQAVVEHGGHPVNESQALPVAPADDLSGGGLDQWGGLGLAAPEAGVRQPDVRSQAGARRLVDRRHLV
jgi:hypothetical protein